MLDGVDDEEIENYISIIKTYIDYIENGEPEEIPELDSNE